MCNARGLKAYKVKRQLEAASSSPTTSLDQNPSDRRSESAYWPRTASPTQTGNVPLLSFDGSNAPSYTIGHYVPSAYPIDSSRRDPSN